MMMISLIYVLSYTVTYLTCLCNMKPHSKELLDMFSIALCESLF